MNRLIYYRYYDATAVRIRTTLMRVLVALLVYIGFSLLSEAIASPADNAPSDITHGTIWLLTEDDISIEAIHLGTEIETDVSGPFAHTRIRQTFRNSSNYWTEGTYVFPLPDDAAVTGMRMRIDDRVVTGVMMEKSLAKASYDRASSNGQRAGLLKQERPNVFRIQIANIAPASEIVMELEFHQELRLKDEYYTLRLPLVVGERYITSSTEGLSDPAYDIGVYTETSDAPGTTNPTSIHVSLDAGTPLADIVSPSHPTAHFTMDGNRYQVELGGNPVAADRDFILRWRPAWSEAPQAAVMTQAEDRYTYSLITLSPPDELYYQPGSTPRDMIFILDVSGSMSGASIRQAKAALNDALQRLNATDRFNLIWFNDQAHSLFNHSEPATEDRLHFAQMQIKRLDATGGTEMRPALSLALGSSMQRGYLQQVIFLTDGNVSNERDLLSQIRATLGNKRLFTVGIGSAPNSFFMKNAARSGRGTYTYISDTAEVEKKIATLLKKLESPALTDIRITPTGNDIEYFDDPIPDIYLGEPVTVALRGQFLPDTLRIEGSIGTNTWQASIDLSSGTRHEGISTVWARRKIESLTARYHEAADATTKTFYRNQVIGISHEHDVISPFTSLVAVEEKPANDSGLLYQQRLKNDRPHGWSVEHENRQMLARIDLPQTATARPLHALLATILLTLCAIFTVALRRL